MLILPKHVAAQMRSRHAADGPVPAAPSAISTDDFIDPQHIAEQVAQFLRYEGAIPRPVGWRVAVLVLTLPDVTAGGVHLVDDHREARAIASPQGIVIALGEQAYDDDTRFKSKTPWVSVGDRVLFQKYGGRMYQLRNGQRIAVLNDTDFSAVVDRGWMAVEGDDAWA